MIQVRAEVPHFNVADIDGTQLSYSSIWQRKNLVLVALPPGDSGESGPYLSCLTAHGRELAELQTCLVITREDITGIEAPGVVVADRWGEVAFAAAADTLEGLPDPDELLDWVRHLQQRCPECQGEAR